MTVGSGPAISTIRLLFHVGRARVLASIIGGWVGDRIMADKTIFSTSTLKLF